MKGKQVFALSVIALAVSQVVYAAEEAQILGEVVVTSRRVETKLDDTPPPIDIIQNKKNIKKKGGGLYG